MPVSYTVSNVGKKNEPPPRSPRPEPYQDQNYYGFVNKSPHQDQGYYGPVNRGPYQDQGYYGPINKSPHQNQGYYDPINRGPYQDQGYYGSVNRGPYQDQGYRGTTNRDPHQGQSYYGSGNRIPYYQDPGYESDLSDNYQDHGYGGYVDPYKNHGGYVINNPPQPYMPNPMGQSQISDIIEWKETPEAHVYKAYLPGVKPGDAEVEVEEDVGMVLNIKFCKGMEYSGQRIQEVHSIMLPDNANIGKVRANMENGVLTVTVPKLTRSVKSYVF